MKYQDKVESAQSKAQEEFDHYIGDILDAEKEQDDEDCFEEGTVETSGFMALDPDDLDADKKDSSNENGCFFKKIELYDIDYLSAETQNLDPDQRQVIDIGVMYAVNVRKFLTGSYSKPTPPLIVGHCGAGCGKSFVINLMTQWQERILRKPGDNPNHPYVLKCAFTGTAASIIDGQTLHHSFSFSFENLYFTFIDEVFMY